MNEGWPDTALRGHTLPVDTRIGGVDITGLVGEGGFGIVYLAWDPSLQRRVAVKEYMPSSLAMRSTDGPGVSVKSERHRETFEAGLKSFVNEARLLARFDHPGLVKVYRFWEAHGTAYMMMPYYEGPTLKAALDRLDRPPDEATLRGWLEPLLDALGLIHEASCFHRDISPDNIILTANGPLLLDFGAARRVIGDMTQALTVVLKPGYAPVEQYGESARMAQGAWTDLYALGCVLHYAITGHAPMTSVERLMDDALPPLATVAAGSYSPAFLRAVDALLAVRPQDRPQDVTAFRALLVPDPPPSGAAVPGRQVEFADLPLPLPMPMQLPLPMPMPKTSADKRRLAVASAGLAVTALLAGTGWWALHRAAPPVVRATSPRAVPASAAAFHEPASFAAPAPVSGAPRAETPADMKQPSQLRIPVDAAPRAASASTRPLPTRASAPVAKAVLPPRCSELLQKASLEALLADETAFLKQECR